MLPCAGTEMLLLLCWPQASALVPPSGISGGLLALNNTSTPMTPKSMSPAGTWPQVQPPAPVCPELTNGHHTHLNAEPTPGPTLRAGHLFSHMLMPKPWRHLGSFLSNSTSSHHSASRNMWNPAPLLPLPPTPWYGPVTSPLDCLLLPLTYEH